MNIARCEPVAVVGMGCRVPGACNPKELWKLLAEGRSAISPAPAERSRSAAEPWHAGFVDGIANFDARFFRLGAQAAKMDPRHRMVLEVTWEACEDAGLSPLGLSAERTGVFLGISGERYNGPDYLAKSPSMAVGYLCHFLDIRGPVVTIDTTCSSSLVAMHDAVRSLGAGECDVAIVGGVNLLFAPPGGASLSFISPRGRSRAFDADADGFGQGEGCIVMVLMRLSAARTERARIYATVLGTAVNHDGRSSSLTAPNPRSQSAVIRQALAVAGVTQQAVQYVEAHGTGTLIGDVIEADALRSVFEGRVGPAVTIGSIKTNIGHLEAAAGLAGVAKVALSISNGMLVPSLNFEKPNPKIPWNDIPLGVQTTASLWPAAGSPRIAGVNSFGMSGTNAHAILGEPYSEHSPALAAGVPAGRGPFILPLSARSPRSLRMAANRMRAALQGELESASCEDIAFSASRGRAHLECRLAVIGDSHAEWIRKLEQAESAAQALEMRPMETVRREEGRRSTGRKGPVMVFPGEGSAMPGMGRHLFDEEPVFREALLRCAQAIRELVEWDLLDELWRDERSTRLHRSDIAQPALFAYQYAATELWRSWGIVPATTVGLGLGEVGAACAAGVLSLEQAAKLVCKRGEIVRRAGFGRGTMLELTATREDADRLCAEFAHRLEVAMTVGPRSTVLSGEEAVVADVAAALEERGVQPKRLSAAFAGYTTRMRSAANELAAGLGDLVCGTSAIPVVSTVTGTRAPLMDAGYWGTQLCSRVCFLEATQALVEEGYRVFLEIGPGSLLRRSLSETVACQGGETKTRVISCDSQDGETRAVAEAFGELYCAGLDVNWAARYPVGRRVDLPTYAWEHAPHWHEVGGPPVLDARAGARAPLASSVDRQAIEDVLLELLAASARSHRMIGSGSAKLSALGIDPGRVPIIWARLSTQLGAEGLPLPVLAADPTLRELADAVLRRTSVEAVPTKTGKARLRVLKRDGAEPMHVWIHPGAGGVTCYRQLIDNLPFKAMGIEAIGAFAQNDSGDSVQSMAARYLRVLEESRTAGPMVLGGWSFGGLVACEMAVQLQEKDRAMALGLVLIDSPIIPDDARLATPSAVGRWVNWHECPRESTPEGMRRVLEDYLILPRASSDTRHPEVARLPASEVERLYSIFYSNMKMGVRYRPVRHGGYPLVISASREAVEPRRRWHEVADRLDWQVVEGDHYSILSEPAVQEVARAVRSYSMRITRAAENDRPVPARMG